ncbi:MAG: hypothetical protein J5745_01365 [Bacteroidales bacterium]|nr:hypothetical protein [Bacteroidales bacterium]
MKKIFKYFVLILSAALATACFPEEVLEDAEVGLGIKTFFPTKVVSGLEMTINGSGFTNLTEIVFPGKAANAETPADPVSVTTFKVVTDNMVRVTVPKNIGPGKIAVKTESENAESKMEITVGNTEISGYSKQEGEEINGGEQLTIYGTDLEFISAVELLLASDDTQLILINDTDFYRKGTSNVAITLPKKLTEKQSVIKGKVYTIDGKTDLLPIPAITFIPAADEGHWETVKTMIWENDDPAGHGAVGWNGTYRFALEGTDGNSEAIAEIPAETWEKMKTTPFYMSYTAADPTSYQVRVTTGWWSVQWLGADNDIAPWNMAERIIDNEDGTFSILVDFSEDPAILDALDAQHLLFTGNGYTPMEIYFQEEVWVGGDSGPKEVLIWENDDPAGHGAIGWNGTYRFALEGTDGNSEAIAEIPADTWEKMKATPFYMSYTAADPTSYQIRVTTGWWSVQWLGADNDIAPWNLAERIVDNEDGTFYIIVDFSEDPAILESLDAQHLLFTGNGYTPLKLYFME